LIKLIVAFRNFANAPKNSISSLQKRYWYCTKNNKN
jgi:hypothetical protein